MRTKDMSLSGKENLKYIGSKNRISKYIVPILQQYIKRNAEKTWDFTNKKTGKGTCVETSYELLEELAEKWETQLLKD